MTFVSGRVIGGRYRLVRPLGEGAIALVWEAEHALFGRVAVKLLRAELARDPESVSRFSSEARAAATISHPNVVRIYDLGQTAEQTPFFAMELCDGETLDITLGARGAMGVDYACELCLQVLAALGAAHAHGIVHRDLKPGNIMVVHPEPDRPLVKVLDFGIAIRVADPVAGSNGRLFGTPHYMAPEQIVGGAVDARTDVYAVGAILFELLTGRPPFTGRNDAEVMTHVMLRPPKPLRAYVRTLPAALETVLRSCLAKEPAGRPPTVEALAKELRGFMAPPAKASAEPVRRPRKKSEPLPLVKRTPGGAAVPAIVSEIEPGAMSEVEPSLTSEPALPLVTRSGPPSPREPKKAVLELVGDEDGTKEP